METPTHWSTIITTPVKGMTLFYYKGCGSRVILILMNFWISASENENISEIGEQNGATCRYAQTKKKRKQIRIIIAPLWLQCFSAQFTFQDIFHFLVRGWFGGGGGGGNHKQLSKRQLLPFLQNCLLAQVNHLWLFVGQILSKLGSNAGL